MKQKKPLPYRLPPEEERDNRLRIAGNHHEEGETEEESIPVGKLKVQQYELIRKNIVLVPVNDAQIPQASSLQDELNEIYGQAVAEWKVSTTDPLRSFKRNIGRIERWRKRCIWPALHRICDSSTGNISAAMIILTGMPTTYS